jgi:glycosyltransferase involved in cell wall biosynthesis
LRFEKIGEVESKPSAVMATIDILLATYNGSPYLGELLESLESQTFQDWRLVVRDDGSSDDSLEIVRAWARRRRQPVEIISDALGPLGACGSFAALMEHSRSPYFALCDQDDVWLPAKLAELLAIMREAETRRGAETPILAHSDLSVVDAQLRPIHPSLNRYVQIRDPPAGQPWRVVLVSNIVTGCASMGNSALRRTALPIPPEAAMHDWWLALVAATFGEIVYLAEPTVLYRQHSVNSVGAGSWSLPGVMLRLLTSPRAHIGKAVSNVRRSQDQAAVFASRYSHMLSSDVRAVLIGYGNIRAKPLPYRKAFLVRHRLRGRNPIYTAILMILA